MQIGGALGLAGAARPAASRRRAAHPDGGRRRGRHRGGVPHAARRRAAGRRGALPRRLRVRRAHPGGPGQRRRPTRSSSRSSASRRCSRTRGRFPFVIEHLLALRRCWRCWSRCWPRCSWRRCARVADAVGAARPCPRGRSPALGGLALGRVLRPDHHVRRLARQRSRARGWACSAAATAPCRWRSAGRRGCRSGGRGRGCCCCSAWPRSWRRR